MGKMWQWTGPNWKNLTVDKIEMIKMWLWTGLEAAGCDTADRAV